MSRPLKEAEKKHGRRWIIRVTEQDDRQARENAKRAGLKFSTYLRAMGRDGKIMPPDPLGALVGAINRAGQLVNQQVALAHLKGELPPELASLNRELETTLTAVLDRLNSSR